MDQNGGYIYPSIVSKNNTFGKHMLTHSPVKLFKIYNCYFLLFTDDIEESITEVHHESEEPTVVNGYQEPGSYVRPIIYPQVTEREQFDEFIARSYTCEQYIRYKCWNSRLLSDAGTKDVPVN